MERIIEHMHEDFLGTRYFVIRPLVRQNCKGASESMSPSPFPVILHLPLIAIEPGAKYIR